MKLLFQEMSQTTGGKQQICTRKMQRFLKTDDKTASLTSASVIVNPFQTVLHNIQGTFCCLQTVRVNGAQYLLLNFWGCFSLIVWKRWAMEASCRHDTAEQSNYLKTQKPRDRHFPFCATVFVLCSLWGDSQRRWRSSCWWFRTAPGRPSPRSRRRWPARSSGPSAPGSCPRCLWGCDSDPRRRILKEKQQGQRDGWANIYIKKGGKKWCEKQGKCNRPFHNFCFKNSYYLIINV